MSTLWGVTVDVWRRWSMLKSVNIKRFPPRKAQITVVRTKKVHSFFLFVLGFYMSGQRNDLVFTRFYYMCINTTDLFHRDVFIKTKMKPKWKNCGILTIAHDSVVCRTTTITLVMSFVGLHWRNFVSVFLSVASFHWGLQTFVSAQHYHIISVEMRSEHGLDHSNILILASSAILL